MAEILAIDHLIHGQRLRQFCRPVGQFFFWSTAQKTHCVQPFTGFERSNEDRVGFARLAGDDIEHPVHAVGEVDIGMARWTEHDGRSLCWTSHVRTIAMTSQITFIGVAVGFCLNDDAGEATAVERTDKQPAKKVFSDLPRGTAVKGTFQALLHEKQH